MKVPTEVAQWRFENFSGNLRSDKQYVNNQGLALKCIARGKYLNWQDESVGINLGLSSTLQTKWHLHLADGKERDILCGEPVSLANGGGDPYVNYSHRTIGINLDWGKKPNFEWQIFGVGVEVGKPIPKGVNCAMLNLRVEPAADWLVYFPRPGGDIGWTTSPHWYDSVTDAVKKAIIEAAKEAAKQAALAVAGGG